MLTISDVELITVTGGQGGRGQSSQQRQERYRNLCLSPNPTEARRQFDVMVEHSGAGVWPKTIKAVGELCGWTPNSGGSEPSTGGASSAGSAGKVLDNMDLDFFRFAR
jgi:hypothetical protein